MKPIRIYSQVPWSLERLKDIAKKHAKNYGKEFCYSKEFTLKTRFGDYKITKELFNTKNYNEFSAEIIKIVTTGKYSVLSEPLLTKDELLKILNKYIRKYLFGKSFNPNKDDNFQLLKIKPVNIIERIIDQFLEFIYQDYIEKLVDSLRRTNSETQMENDILRSQIEYVREENRKLEAQIKTEQEQKINEILETTKDIKKLLESQNKVK